jgi:hypothetical protein
METIKKLSDLEPGDLPVVERFFGLHLDATANAVLILRVENRPSAPEEDGVAPLGDVATGDTLPDWCDMYAGLSDAQIADLEAVVLKRADLTRSLD